MTDLLSLLSKFSAIILAFVTGGGLIALFRYLTTRGDQTIKNKAQDLAGFQVYTEKLEARITLLEHRLDDQDKVIEGLQKDKTELTITVSEQAATIRQQAVTIKDLQKQITHNKK